VTDVSLTSLVFLPVGLGLLGFIEPCSIGSTLIVIKQLEGKSAASKLAQVGVFAGTRAVFIGLLGMLAVVLGTAFLGVQQGAWVVLGAVYVLIGLLYVAGKTDVLRVPLGPSLARLSDLPGSASLGVLLGFNIPACAAPLLLALLSTAAVRGAAGGTLATGFVSLALFGFALSLPLVVAVLFEPARRAIDWLAGLSRRLPLWTGMFLIALGSWSIWLAVSTPVKV
jgi:cytochrome c-type biogenesis protein